MKKRTFWLKLISELWDERSIIWLSGTRRAGKTTLCQSIEGIEYFDCELPRTRKLMADPQAFLDSLRGKKVVLDEIHRLANPSELLKIAADHYKTVRIIASGSSTLGASAKFKDTLAGRKRNIWLTPMCTFDLEDFENEQLETRFLRGGLPPFYLSKSFPERDFQEWVDAFWAKDIQELFRLANRDSFQKFFELLITQSGSIFEATRFAKPCEVSRTTIANYLRILEATYIAHVIRPFSSHRPTEIISAPKVYAFDTGFFCYYRGWHSLRSEDLGFLWEHFVLNEIQARLQTRKILYWRDKSGHEIDFVMAANGRAPVAIECKWSIDHFDPKNLRAFRRQHPSGKNFVVTNDAVRSHSRKVGAIAIEMVSIKGLIDSLKKYQDSDSE